MQLGPDWNSPCAHEVGKGETLLRLSGEDPTWAEGKDPSMRRPTQRASGSMTLRSARQRTRHFGMFSHLLLTKDLR